MHPILLAEPQLPAALIDLVLPALLAEQVRFRQELPAALSKLVRVMSLVYIVLPASRPELVLPASLVELVRPILLVEE